MRDIDEVVSNERLEKLSEYDCADRYEVMSMATELLALRKERERADPVGVALELWRHNNLAFAGYKTHAGNQSKLATRYTATLRRTARAGCA